MNVLRVRNANQVLPAALEIMRQAGVLRNSRNGPVLQCEGPVSTVYEKPTERVSFWPERDANPFFHLFESMWMLGGRNDTKSMSRFIKNFSQYSDNGEIFHGAYGHRWRHSFSHDQLKIIVERLRENKEDRRSVLQMWDSTSDLNNPSKDVPCNTMATFQIGSNGHLDLVVFNRSNDIIWGAYGANVVQFSTLLEYMARCIGVPVGTYTQISVNWHAYKNVFDELCEKFKTSLYETTGIEGGDIAQCLDDPTDPYTSGQVKPYPLIGLGSTQELWDTDLRNLLRYSGRAPTDGHFKDPFFGEVLIPILRAHDCFKQMEDEAKYEKALEALQDCRASDWRLACEEWITRRYLKWKS